eukprot:TRINITY_DN3755_c0_g1_i2.p1 TRINITY_DN3755_c0_g1~~TRINITY_DN3755_c0_g1_i2.p1  ORF type:complete len:644 (-),score=210.37 TRINITY_DN3755_c0_g1_i2:211-2061(-)
MAQADGLIAGRIDPQMVGSPDGNAKDERRGSIDKGGKGGAMKKLRQTLRPRPPKSPDAEDGEEPAGSQYDFPKKHRQLFVDAKQMKDKLRENMRKPRYDVANYYWDEGYCQQIARHCMFENVTLFVISLNAAWLAIDTDLNTAETLSEADTVFVLGENFFCFYFTFEWAMRFCAFEFKTDGLRDGWFVFDSVLVFFMVAETWVMFIVMKINGGGASINTGVLKLLKLLRLSRMARMARLLRSMPELLIMIKGMVAAIRSVFFTLLLLVLLIYIFGVFFRQMTRGLKVGDDHFFSIARSMHTLLLHGIFLDDLSGFVSSLEDEKNAYHLLFAYYLFILFGSLTVMNMLIGVLCEVVAAVAATEHEELTIVYTREKLLQIIHDCEKDLVDKSQEPIPKGPNGEIDENEYRISKVEFLIIFQKPDTAELLNEIEVDVLALVDLVDTIFTAEDGSELKLTFGDLVEVMLDQRATNGCTLKDLTDMRKYLRVRVDALEDDLDDVEELQALKVIKLEAHLQVLGDLVEKVAGVEQGFFKQTAAKKLADARIKLQEETVIKDLARKQAEEKAKEQALQQYAVTKQKNEEIAVRKQKEAEESKKNGWIMKTKSGSGGRGQTDTE